MATTPVTGGKVIGTPYAGTHTLGNWESDNAVDIAVPIGTPVYAVEAGTIGPQFGSTGTSGRFEGLRLHLNGAADSFYYAHLSSYAAGIRPGKQVNAGDLLGYSGIANGVAHLHFASTTNVSPLDFVKGLPGAVADALGGSSTDTAPAAASTGSSADLAAAQAAGCATLALGALLVVPATLGGALALPTIIGWLT